MYAINPQRQVFGVDHLAGIDRGQRHLGRWDAPQIVTLDVVGIVGELRQLTGRRQRRRRDERRRTDLFELVDVAIERVLAQRPRQRRAAAALHREHRPTDLGGALVVEDAERCAGLPVRDSSMLGELRGEVDRSLDERVVFLAVAIGGVGMRKVGDAQQHVAQIALDDVELVGQYPLVVTECTTAQLQFLSTFACRLCGAVHRRPSTGR